MTKHSHIGLTISGITYLEPDLKQFAENQLGTKLLPNWEIPIFEFILKWISSDAKIQVQTSGSTGSSKIVEVDKVHMIKSAELTGQFFNLRNGDKSLFCLPVDFIAGKMMIVRAFVLDLNLIPVEPSGNPLENINMDFDFAAMTPFQVFNVLGTEEGFMKLNNIKNLIIGGGKISHNLIGKIRNLKNNTYHTYGMTETITHVAVKKLNGENPDRYFSALPGISFSIDERSCLVIAAPHLNEKEIITNDIVELVDDKTFEFIGRIDNVINSGGIKISPEKIEQMLAPFISSRFVVVGLPDEKLGQKIVLVLENKSDQKIDLNNVIAYLPFSKYEFPKQVLTLKKFPETENGKIIRKKIIEQLHPAKEQ